MLLAISIEKLQKYMGTAAQQTGLVASQSIKATNIYVHYIANL